MLWWQSYLVEGRLSYLVPFREWSWRKSERYVCIYHLSDLQKKLYIEPRILTHTLTGEPRSVADLIKVIFVWCVLIQVTELLAKAGASIQELNMFRKYFSQTKGGRLAEATYPAQVSSLFSES